MKTIILFLVVRGLWAVDAPQKTDTVVSWSGQLKMSEYLQKLKAGIQETQSNMDICDRNQETLKKEIQALNLLEKEHVDLEQGYAKYVKSAQEEIGKNQSALMELDKWEKHYQKAPKEFQESMRMKFDAAKGERAERVRWDADAKAKLEKTQQLRKNISVALKDIAAKRRELDEQINFWKQKRNSLQTDLSNFQQKKTAVERAIAQVQQGYKETYPASPKK